MQAFSTVISIRWADIDANFHLRHSAYYDFGAQHRVDILAQHGLTLATMRDLHVGPVLFREECVFKKEIHLTDKITISTCMAKMRADGSRFTIQHLFTNEYGQRCALLTVEGAWIDTRLRKLAHPVPAIITEVMKQFPRGEGFEEV
ncbi:thioesterase [Ilyomonas limi]|uniref:Thioesterase n=1 Tax=Ilyomonas limi TaxID=2575867 RepID=A0A4U3L645_9BACT|nr:thioesterase family protein [Ilyomonas limi]TKK69834.1 thioesterase [Ilyomonas limi]